MVKENAKRLQRKKQSALYKQEKMDCGLMVNKYYQSFHVPNVPFSHKYFKIEKKKKWNVTMRIPHLRYLNHFWRMMQQRTIAPSVMKCFPNMKEISESMSAFLQLKPYMEQVDTVLSIGDGGTPRTGALFSCLYPTKQIYSIDPQLSVWRENKEDSNLTNPNNKDSNPNNKDSNPNNKDSNPNNKNSAALPSNLHVFGMTVEAFLLLQPQVVKEAKGIAIANVHSHAVFNQFMPKLLTETSHYVVIFALKCCGIQQSFSSEQLELYAIKEEKTDFDFGVHSCQRGYKIWTREV
jgi:hypothetical protein